MLENLIFGRDGLIPIADVFARWVENLLMFWNYLNTPVTSMIDSSINSISGNVESVPAIALFTLVKTILNIAGFGSFTMLGLMFALMGSAFAFFAVIQIVKWLLDVFY